MTPRKEMREAHAPPHRRHPDCIAAPGGVVPGLVLEGDGLLELAQSLTSSGEVFHEAEALGGGPGRGARVASVEPVEGGAQVVGGFLIGEALQRAASRGCEVANGLVGVSLDRPACEMESQLLGVVERSRSVATLERGGDLPVHEPLPGQADLPHQNLAHHRVLELVQRAFLAAGFVEQVAPAQLLQRLDQLGLVERAYGPKGLVPRARPNERYHLGHLAGGGG